MSGEGTHSGEAAVLVDRSFGVRGQSYDLSEIRRTGAGHLLRVRIHRDSYPQQSYARVEVLTPAMTWTDLADEPAAAWHSGTPSRSTTATPLENIAERLFQRAAAILHTA
ncbi:hypothetical protein [Micromonospora sp. NPDC047134]|uniref:hypothetical protein n=1 Tax=Micromonospora sp. NPDC047134 TaxID=3154340 RepID=UPI0033EA14DC